MTRARSGPLEQPEPLTPSHVPDRQTFVSPLSAASRSPLRSSMPSALSIRAVAPSEDGILNLISQCEAQLPAGTAEIVYITRDTRVGSVFSAITKRFFSYDHGD
nr:hypothetical protein Iba_chr04cCG15700 [Ipomoea batatas]